MMVVLSFVFVDNFLDCHGKCTYNNVVNVLPISHVESVLTKLQCFAQECYWLSP